MENINSNVWVERIKEDDYETICGSITGTQEEILKTK